MKMLLYGFFDEKYVIFYSVEKVFVFFEVIFISVGKVKKVKKEKVVYNVSIGFCIVVVFG